MSEGSGRTKRALALVQKVVRVTIDRRACDASGAREGMRATLVEHAAVRALHVTSHLARQLARAPFPAATATQRFALSTMAAQLRAAASGILAGEASHDRATVEGALAEVIRDTLILVEAALREDAQLEASDDAIQVTSPPRLPSRTDGGSPSG